VLWFNHSKDDMMDNKKNIDRLFQEKFKNFEETPNDAVWKKIQEKQNANHKRGLIIPLWYKIGGVAALVTLISTIGYISTDTPAIHTNINAPSPVTSDKLATNHINSSVVDNQHGSKSDFDTTKSPITPVIAQNRINKSAKEQKSNQDPYNYAEPNVSQEKKIAQNDAAITSSKQDSSEEYKNRIAQNSDIPNTVAATKNKVAQDTLSEKNKKSIFEAIAENDNTENQKEPKNEKRWNITPNIAPVYYDTFAEGSSVRSEFSGNNKTGEVNMSYGVKVAYQINKKLSIRSGVHKLDLAYNTSDVFFNASTKAASFEGINFNSNTKDIVVSNRSATVKTNTASQDITSQIGSFTSSVPTNNTNSGSLNHQIGYIEVPIEASYTLIDRKFGMQLMGGVSTLFLSSNDIFLLAGDFVSDLGQGSNVDSIGFTTNVGLGFNYKLSKQFVINMEPVIKYQFSGFNNSSQNFRPYAIGVYSGVTFKF